MTDELFTCASELLDADAVKQLALRDLNLRRTTDRRRLVEMFRSIGNGSFRPSGHDGSGLMGGLLFPRKDVQARISSFSVQVQLNVQQIAHLTGAHYDAVKGWIDAGLLPATQAVDLHGRPWLVDLGELIQFLLRFCPLASLATQMGSSSRGLANDLARRRVRVEGAIERGALVRISDLVRVEDRN